MGEGRSFEMIKLILPLLFISNVAYSKECPETKMVDLSGLGFVQ
jgi:hypothetical protein